MRAHIHTQAHTEMEKENPHSCRCDFSYAELTACSQSLVRFCLNRIHTKAGDGNERVIHTVGREQALGLSCSHESTGNACGRLKEKKAGVSLVLRAPASPAEPLDLPDYLEQSGISGAVPGPLDSVVILCGIPNGTTTATRWHQTVAKPGMDLTRSAGLPESSAASWKDPHQPLHCQLHNRSQFTRPNSWQFIQPTAGRFYLSMYNYN